MWIKIHNGNPGLYPEFPLISAGSSTEEPPNEVVIPLVMKKNFKIFIENPRMYPGCPLTTTSPWTVGVSSKLLSFSVARAFVVKNELISVTQSGVRIFARMLIFQTCLGLIPGSGSFRNNKGEKKCLFLRKRLTINGLLAGLCGWSGHKIAASTSQL